MMTMIPLHVQKSAKSDIDYMLRIVNMDEDLDAELLGLRLELEDGEDDIFDISVYSTISFGYDPRQYLEFDWDYFVDGDTIKFWNHDDINMLANELRNRIECRKKVVKYENY